MQLDRRQEFINTWFIWIALHIIGCTFGAFFGEVCAQSLLTFNLNLAHLVAFALYEIIVWIPRRIVFRQIGFDQTWTRMTQVIWLVTEIIGWTVGAHLLRTVLKPHFTEGVVFGSLISASIWFVLWCVQSAPRGRWWSVIATFFGLAGFCIAIGIMTIVLVLNDDIRRAVVSTPFSLAADALAGCVVGLTTGCLTGLVVASQQMKIKRLIGEE